MHCAKYLLQLVRQHDERRRRNHRCNLLLHRLHLLLLQERQLLRMLWSQLHGVAAGRQPTCSCPHVSSRQQLTAS